MKETTKFLKVRDVISPSRAYTTDAGIDFYVPKFDKKFIDDIKSKNEEMFTDESSKCNHATFSISTGISSSNSNTASKSLLSYDLIDNNNSFFKFDDEKGKLYFNLLPHQRVLIPSGIHARMASDNRALIANNKSGVAIKLGLIFCSAVVDYEYQGEIFISVLNTSTKIVRIYEDMKIIQFIETPVIVNPIEVTDVTNNDKYVIDDFYKGFKSERKDGCLNSTDKSKQLNS